MERGPRPRGNVMYDYGSLFNVTGNQQRGQQFGSGSNFSSTGGGPATGAQPAPMNLMPQNPGMQPGMNLKGMFGLLNGAFGQGQMPMGGLASMLGSGNMPAGAIPTSIAQLANVFGQFRQPQPPTPGGLR